MPEEFGMDLAPNTASSIAVQLNQVIRNNSLNIEVQTKAFSHEILSDELFSD